MYAWISSRENVSVGWYVIFWKAIGSRDIVSGDEMFRTEVPLLISFICGSSVVIRKPGFIERDWVWFVCGSIANCFSIVEAFSSSDSLYRISLIFIVKFPARVV